MAIIGKPGTKAAMVIDLAIKGYSIKETAAELKAQGVFTPKPYIEGVLRSYGLIGKQNKLQHQVDTLESMVFEILVIVKQLCNLPDAEIQRRIQDVKDRTDEEVAAKVARVRQERVDEAAQALKESIAERSKRRVKTMSRKRSIKRRTSEERQALDLLGKLAKEIEKVKAAPKAG